MPFYIGSECAICGKAFTDDDDIVVCPQCGSPHHRACYKITGHCGNQDEYHAAGQQWQATAPNYTPDDPVQDIVVCRACGEHNPAINIFCQKCGQKILGTPQGSPPDHGYPYSPQYGDQPGQPGGGDPFANFLGAQLDYDEKLAQGVTLKDAVDYVGPNSLPFAFKFKNLSQGGFSFNWAAFFFGYLYCFYRKMYRLGAILMAFFLVQLVPICYFAMQVARDSLAATGGVITFPMELNVNSEAYSSMLMVLLVFRLVSLACMFFCGFSFNRLYFRRMVSRIQRLCSNGPVTPNTPEYRGAVSGLGGVNHSAPFIAIGVAFIVYMALAYGFAALLAAPLLA